MYALSALDRPAAVICLYAGIDSIDTSNTLSEAHGLAK
jgi:hypothetical protein